MHLSIEWLPPVRPAPQLLILLHGRGATGASMRPLAQALREAFPQAAILAPDAPPPGAAGGTTRRDAGRAWFDAAADAAADDADDAGERDGTQLAPATAVALARTALQAWIGAQQARLGIAPQATAIAGLGQGATLALALACAADGLAGRVLAFGGGFADLPETAPALTTLHLLHGAADPEWPVRHARRALTHLGAIQADATLDIAEGVGHGLHPALIDSALFRLRNHIPHRTWRAALGAAPRPRGGVADASDRCDPSDPSDPSAPSHPPGPDGRAS
jgi:phospholipase/carboxylesterase